MESTASKYEVHPAADLFPLMSEAEYQGLKEDINENGQREDIVVWKGQLIDGRNRLRACNELGRNPSIAELDDDLDPLSYVISHNLHRRHLTTSQRSDVAAKIATMRQGARTDLGSKDTKSIEEAAKELNVSPASVKRAKKVHAKGSDETKKAVSDGSVPVAAAAKFVDAVPNKVEQAAIVAKGPAAVKEAAKAVPKRVKAGEGVPKENVVTKIKRLYENACFLDRNAVCELLSDDVFAWSKLRNAEVPS